MTPFFSIVVPVYNRERLIRRCLSSCLSQSFGDFEIIVVDDASTDETIGAVNSFSDSRIRIARHNTNRGVCPARNTGIDASSGRWVVCLDSDDELNAGALDAIRERAEESGEEISGLRFMCRFDSGRLSPEPALKDEVWGYEEYVRWLEEISRGMGESLVVVRKDTFGKVR